MILGNFLNLTIRMATSVGVPLAYGFHRERRRPAIPFRNFLIILSGFFSLPCITGRAYIAQQTLFVSKTRAEEVDNVESRRAALTLEAAERRRHGPQKERRCEDTTKSASRNTERSDLYLYFHQERRQHMMTVKPHKPFMPPTGLACAGLLAGLLAGLTSAAAQMTSTAELKLACETNPGNVVTINVNTQISTGPRPPLAEMVTTPCTLVLAPLVTFEAGQVGMNFNGAFTIQGAGEAQGLFIESEFAARSVSVTQSDKSALLLDRSLFRATGGGITINTGAEGIVDLRGPIASGNLVATGAIAISGGQKFAVTLADAHIQAGTTLSMTMSGPESHLVTTTSTVNANRTLTIAGGTRFVGQLNDTQLNARTGLAVTLTGAEGLFSAVTSTLDTVNGSINITSTGDKGVVELKLGSVATGRNGVTVSLTGNESNLNANEFSIDGGTGAVLLQSQGNVSKLTAVLGVINAGGAITARAATTAQYGVALVEKVQASAGQAIRVETGAFGVTETKDNTLTSPTLVRIASGAGGGCTSLNNILSAPVQQICP